MGCGGGKGPSTEEPSTTSSNKRLLEGYSVGSHLGEGAFGVVYACTNRVTGEEVAVKMVDKVETPVEKIRQEAELMQDLVHPNVVRFHQVFYERCFVCIVMAQFSGGDLVEGLHTHLKEKGKINCFDIVHVSRQMAAGVQYLHSKTIVHRDVKGDNFLMDRRNIVDPNCVVALSDFGTATYVKQGERLSAEVGTKLFWSPEFFAKNYAHKVDTWAMGIIMFGLLDGRFPFKDESDIKNKEPRYPKKMPDDCRSYLQGLLEKKEQQRLSADEAICHRWNTQRASKISTSRVYNGAELDIFEKEENVDAESMRQDGADHGIAERRRELMERLDVEMQNKVNRDNKSQHSAETKKHEMQQQQHFRAKWFTVVDKHTPGSTLKFEWWDVGRVKQNVFLEMKAPACHAKDLDRSPTVVEKCLQEHNINTTSFGTGEAKTLAQLATEISSGAARLMLDATEHKKLVRVVDVVLLRLYTSSGSNGKILMETAEQYPDGRRRAIARLPGTKKEPHENSQETAQRVLTDFLNMGDITVCFDFAARESFEEENESPSYPGVRTVYRKQIVKGFLTTTDTRALSKIGLPSGSAWNFQDSKKNTKFFSWMTEKQALARQVKFQVESGAVSALVMAPIGLNPTELTVYLQRHGISTERYGTNSMKTIKEFSAELVKGECSLMDGPTGDPLRVVDLVILKITNPDTGNILVQTEQNFKDGTRSTACQLPGSKRRPDENQFLTARRVLRKQLKIYENHVRLDSNNVLLTEELRETPMYGMKTVLRKRIIACELCPP
mmetsp:Transcript_24488/g.68094  ORF Transcript_24488/g.68094 Transcript_24488/m.68094 type:complete len:781 (-) Transcript_24488:84-2426(-)